MAWFLGLGITGVVLLALSLVFDGVLEGARRTHEVVPRPVRAV
jgi:hypothetical protein